MARQELGPHDREVLAAQNSDSRRKNARDASAVIGLLSALPQSACLPRSSETIRGRKQRRQAANESARGSNATRQLQDQRCKRFTAYLGPWQARQAKRDAR